MLFTFQIITIEPKTQTFSGLTSRKTECLKVTYNFWTVNKIDEGMIMQGVSIFLADKNHDGVNLSCTIVYMYIIYLEFVGCLYLYHLDCL